MFTFAKVGSEGAPDAFVPVNAIPNEPTVAAFVLVDAVVAVNVIVTDATPVVAATQLPPRVVFDQ